MASAEVTVAPGSSFTWDGIDGPIVPSGVVPANLATKPGALAFAIDSGHQPTHSIPGLNNGLYGNSNSWIGVSTRSIDVGGGTVVSTTFAGIDFAGTGLNNVTSFAFGRSNLGNEFADRTAGTYYVQTTTTPDPSISTPDAQWSTIGSINISSNAFGDTYRHLYSLDPAVAATGIRVVTPGSGTCIDEIEVYGNDAPPLLVPAEEGGGVEIDNLAAAGTAFAKDVLGGRSIGSLNDEIFGDARAWVGATPDSFVGISLGAVQVPVGSIAFGRDNTGAQTDRALGEYLVQITDVSNPGAATPDGDWITVGSITYAAGSPANPHLRHRFNIGTRQVTGVRLLTPDGAAIDELEVYEAAYVPPPPPALIITPADGFSATWDGNDGDHFDQNPPPDGAVVPDNLALASNGGIPFASSTSAHFPPHEIPNLNDGYYGNADSHINGQGPPQSFMGIALPGPTALTAIAWGRDNGNGAFDDSSAGTDCCGGQVDDRSVGIYTLQFTNVANPDASTPDGDWTNIAEFNYTEGIGGVGTDNAPGGLFTEWLRHQYEIGTAGGDPIVATGVRIILPNIAIAIDEIELYEAVGPPQAPTLEIDRDPVTGDLTLTWNSKAGRLYNLRSETDPGAAAPIDWPIFDGNQDLAATPPMNSVTFPLPAEEERFFVVEEFPAPPVDALADDFEGGQGGWTTGSEGLAGTAWELGAPSNVGPAAAKSPANCFATNISAEYGVDANVWLRSPAIDLSAASGATLSYAEFIDIEKDFDSGTVRVLDAGDDSELAVITAVVDGVTTDWRTVTRSIPAAALGKTIKLEFRFQSDDLMNQAGWYIDDVRVTVP